MVRLPGFTKFFYPDTSSERLPLPVAYSQVLGSSTSSVAYLRNFDGQTMEVTLTKDGDTWFFQDGWKVLVKAINAEAGDLFSFDFACDATFEFRLFGANGCIKPTTWTPLPTEIEGHREEVENETRTHDKKHKDKGKYVIEDKDLEEIEYQFDKDPGPRRMKKGGKKNGKDAIQVDDALPNSVLEVKNKSERRHKGNYRRQERSTAEEEEVFQYGVISHPQNPHFIAKIYEKKHRDLCIPREVVDKYNLQLPANIVLVDERNRKWEGEVSYWKDGRIWVIHGWKAFRRWNVLKPEDKCLCEFIPRDGQQDLYLKMRVLRGWSWLPESSQEE